MRGSERPVGLLLILAICLSAPAADSAGAESFQGLGALKGGPYLYSNPNDMSRDGSVIVGESLSAKGFEAFRWTASGGMVGLGGLGGEIFSSLASGVSADGHVVVGGSISPESGSRSEAFSWTAESGMVGLGDLPGGAFASSAESVSADGSVITGSSASKLCPTTGEGFLWTANIGLVGLGVLDETTPTPTSVPERLSAAGEVVVGWSYSRKGQEAFRWTASEGMVGLGDLPAGAFASEARGLSADGSVVVGGALNPGIASFRWTQSSGMVELERPQGANGSSALDVSDDGNVVVGYAGLGGDVIPTIWTPEEGMRNLVDVLIERGLGDQMAGWDLERATTISGDGLAIAGRGYNPDGDVEAWVAYLGPSGPSLLEVPATSKVGLAALGILIACVALFFLRPR